MTPPLAASITSAAVRVATAVGAAPDAPVTGSTVVPDPAPSDAPAASSPAAADATADAAAARDPRAESTDAALRALTAHVVHASDPDGLRIAFRAYFNYRHANPDAVRKPYLYYVDMGLDNRVARGYVFDMDRLALVEGPFHVSHGRGSLKERDGVPTRFSNVPNSYQTSLGLYLAEETYNFRGNSSGRPYSSIGLRLRGESGAFNDAARRRGIVAHGAPYVSARDAGRSEGCPAMEQERARRLLPMIAEGGVVFIYSPRDLAWLSSDPWLNAD
ncbi:MAG TPA: murein L,D-transpeptidase catalytic domain family protein [Longimicrobiales bacterium]|nr:murein L,D-transpeptidase catalytic domain family protein [Longimicrobiales bacterium]